MQKYIYLAEAIDGVDYDECESCVVVAYSLKEAKAIASKLVETESFDIKKVGIALKNIKLGILHSSYKAG